MSDRISFVNRTTLMLAAVIIALFALMNLLDLGNQTFSGLQIRNNKVVRVYPNSPAEQAGFQVGDRIITNGGVDVSDTKTLTERPRPEIGLERPFVVDRAGSQQTLTLVYGGLPAQQMAINVAAVLIGLSFVAFGLWPFLKVGTHTAGLLAIVCVCLGFSFVGPPYFSSYAVRTALAVVTIPIVVLGIAALLHFMLSFSTPSSWLEKKGAARRLYAPAVIITIYVLFLILVRPDATSMLNQINTVLFGLFFAGYLLMSMIVILRKYLAASTMQREAYGLSLMMAGVVIAFLPAVVTSLLGIVFPSLVLPGSQFYFLTLAVLPPVFALAVMKEAATVNAEAA